MNLVYYTQKLILETKYEGQARKLVGVKTGENLFIPSEMQDQNHNP